MYVTVLAKSNASSDEAESCPTNSTRVDSNLWPCLARSGSGVRKIVLLLFVKYIRTLARGSDLGQSPYKKNNSDYVV